MKRLHLFILRSYTGPFIMTFFIALFILLMQFLWKYIEDFVGKGLDWTVIAELLMYASAGLVPMALPLAILLASLMTFGNLGENYELTAIKSAGISLQRIMFPLIFLTMLISIGAFFFSNNVLPYTNLKLGALLFDVSRQRPELNIKEGIFNNDIENMTIRVNDKHPETNMMYDFMLYDHSQYQGNTTVVIADSASMVVTNDERYMILTIYNGWRYEEMHEQRRRQEREFPLRKDHFAMQQIRISLAGFAFSETDESLFKSNYQMMNLDQLAFSIDSLHNLVDNRRTRFENSLLRTKYFKSEVKQFRQTDSMRQALTEASGGDTLRVQDIHKIDEIQVVTNLDSLFNSLPRSRQTQVLKNALNNARMTKDEIVRNKEELTNRIRYIWRHEVEWHRKFTLSFACFIFFFIGAPLGAIIRKGGLGMPVVVSVLFFVIYYVISLTGDKFAREGILDAWQGMWLSSVILLPLGIFLTYKASSDSVIMNMDTYIETVKKFLRFGKKWRKKYAPYPGRPKIKRTKDRKAIFSGENPSKKPDEN